MRPQTHEAGRQNVGDLIEPLGGAEMGGVERIHRKSSALRFVGDQFSDEFYRWSRRSKAIGAVRQIAVLCGDVGQRGPDRDGLHALNKFRPELMTAPRLVETGVIAIPARRTPQDQLQAERTTPPSHSGRQA